MAASSIPAAKQAILDLLAARPLLADVTRSWGAPEGNKFDREHIFIGNADFTQDWTVIRPPVEPKEETYTIALGIVVTVLGTGKDQKPAELRAFALMEECQLAIRADPSLSGTIRFGHLRRGTQNSEPVPSGWTATLNTLIDCRARI